MLVKDSGTPLQSAQESVYYTILTKSKKAAPAKKKSDAARKGSTRSAMRSRSRN